MFMLDMDFELYFLMLHLDEFAFYGKCSERTCGRLYSDWNYAWGIVQAVKLIWKYQATSGSRYFVSIRNVQFAAWLNFAV